MMRWGTVRHLTGFLGESAEMCDAVQTIRYWTIQAITGCPLGHEKGGGLACQDCIEMAMESLIQNLVQELLTIVNAAAAERALIRRSHECDSIIPAPGPVEVIDAPVVSPPERTDDLLDAPRHVHYCSVGDHQVDCIIMICRHGKPRACWECKMKSPGVGRH